MRRVLLLAVVTLAAPLAYAGTVTCRDRIEQPTARACDQHGGIARQIAAPEGQADKVPATPRAQASEVAPPLKPPPHPSAAPNK